MQHTFCGRKYDKWNSAENAEPLQILAQNAADFRQIWKIPQHAQSVGLTSNGFLRFRRVSTR